MPLDTRIALGVQAPQIDIAGSMERGMNLRSMAQKRDAQDREESDRMTMNDIMKRATKVGPDGRMSVDRGLAMSELAGKLSPDRAMQFQKQLDDMDTESLKRVTEQAESLWTGANQANWGETRQRAIQMNLPNADKLPEVYSPQFHDRLLLGTMKGKEQLQLRLQQDQLANTKNYQNRTLALQEQALMQKSNAASTRLAGKNEGTKALDKDYAKDFNDFTSQGAENARASIKKLESIRDELTANKDSWTAGGGRMSSLPDMVRSRDSIRWRDQAQSAANSTLKSIFGGQLSDGERKSAAAEYYNDSLSNEENAKILTDKITTAQQGLANELAKADYFRKNGTLAGFSESSALNMQASYQSPKAPRSEANQVQTYTTDQIDWAE